MQIMHSYTEMGIQMRTSSQLCFQKLRRIKQRKAQPNSWGGEIPPQFFISGYRRNTAQTVSPWQAPCPEFLRQT